MQNACRLGSCSTPFGTALLSTVCSVQATNEAVVSQRLFCALLCPRCQAKEQKNAAHRHIRSFVLIFEFLLAHKGKQRNSSLGIFAAAPCLCFQAEGDANKHPDWAGALSRVLFTASRCTGNCDLSQVRPQCLQLKAYFRSPGTADGTQSESRWKIIQRFWYYRRQSGGIFS